MWIFRAHLLPSPYNKSYRKVRQRYLSEVQRGILPTHAEIEEWIMRKLPNERVHEATFSVQVTQEMIDATTVESSLEAYYEDMTRGEEVQCVGTRTRKRIRCVICQSSKFTKVKITCGHVFHRKCIDEWLRWKKECPICKAEVELKKDIGT